MLVKDRCPHVWCPAFLRKELRKHIKVWNSKEKTPTLRACKLYKRDSWICPIKKKFPSGLKRNAANNRKRRASLWRFQHYKQCEIKLSERDEVFHRKINLQSVEKIVFSWRKKWAIWSVDYALLYVRGGNDLLSDRTISEEGPSIKLSVKHQNAVVKKNFVKHKEAQTKNSVDAFCELLFNSLEPKKSLTYLGAQFLLNVLFSPIRLLCSFINWIKLPIFY